MESYCSGDLNHSYTLIEFTLNVYIISHNFINIFSNKYVECVHNIVVKLFIFTSVLNEY